MQDFSYLAKRYEDDATLLSRSSYWEILYHLGKAHQTLEEEEQARATWEKLIAAKPSQRYLRLLRAEGMDVGELDEDAETAEMRARLLQEGISLHDRGLNGEKSAAQQALELFAAAVEDYPDDALLKAYHGSSVSLVGRYADDANVMFASAIKGMKILDDAVKLAPQETRVRLVRAHHAMRLPELFFRRTGVAIVDLEFIRDRYAEGVADLTKDEWLEVLWMLGNAYFRLDIVEDAQATWNVLLKEDPTGTYKASIDAMLAPVNAEVETKEIDPHGKETRSCKRGFASTTWGFKGTRASLRRRMSSSSGRTSSIPMIRWPAPTMAVSPHSPSETAPIPLRHSDRSFRR